MYSLLLPVPKATGYQHCSEMFQEIKPKQNDIWVSGGMWLTSGCKKEEFVGSEFIL